MHSTASDFAVAMGFEIADLHTNASIEKYQNWIQGNCQPNFWQVVFHPFTNLFTIIVMYINLKY
jgi:hypothetical protein